jgi:3-methyl-2-oxobutanoate hydroxymethyltransferase
MKKITVPEIQRMKERGEKITMLTAYDAPMAEIIDECGIDMILVGDSVGTVISGYPNTLPVTVEEMIYHTKAVCRKVKRALVVIDMPFMSYQVSIEEAKRNAGRMIKESGAEAVKIEGGISVKDVVKAIVDIDIPVVGHIGLTPQSIHKFGGYKIQKQREKLLEDAKAIEEAGAFAIVLECIPEEIAKEITETLTIPTIGIGAGRYCDGQVLVIHDLLGMLGDFRPKFVKRYVDLRSIISKAVKEFIEEVKTGAFPTEEHIFRM